MKKATEMKRIDSTVSNITDNIAMHTSPSTLMTLTVKKIWKGTKRSKE